MCLNCMKKSSGEKENMAPLAAPSLQEGLLIASTTRKVMDDNKALELVKENQKFDELLKSLNDRILCEDYENLKWGTRPNRMSSITKYGTNDPDNAYYVGLLRRIVGPALMVNTDVMWKIEKDGDGCYDATKLLFHEFGWDRVEIMRLIKNRHQNIRHRMSNKRKNMYVKKRRVKSLQGIRKFSAIEPRLKQELSHCVDSKLGYSSKFMTPRKIESIGDDTLKVNVRSELRHIEPKKKTLKTNAICEALIRTTPVDCGVDDVYNFELCDDSHGIPHIGDVARSKRKKKKQKKSSKKKVVTKLPQENTNKDFIEERKGAAAEIAARMDKRYVVNSIWDKQSTMGIATVVGEPTDEEFRRNPKLDAGHVKCEDLAILGDKRHTNEWIPPGWMFKYGGGELLSFAKAVKYNKKKKQPVWLWYEWLELEYDAINQTYINN